MKRKWVALALPLALLSLLLGVKWRAEHPTPTKADLKFQKFLSQSSTINITHFRHPFGNYATKISPQDFKPLASKFYLFPSPSNRQFINVGSKGLLIVQCFPANAGSNRSSTVTIKINLDDRRGRVSGLTIRPTPEQNIHPVTTKRWLELLLEHPRIGPELRARLK